MNMFLLQRDVYNRLYNCTDFHTNDVPLASRQHIVESIITIVMCAIFYILYIPCIYSIYKHRDNACYKLLLYISITDCSILWLLGFVHGILGIYGAVFCTFPTFIYPAGVAVTAIWAAESVMEISLSVNRCLAILSPRIEKMLFKGWRTYIWLWAATLYALFWAWYFKPVLFTGVYFTWTFDPFIGYRKTTDIKFENFVHTVHDIANAIAVPSIYGIFFVLFILKTKSFGQANSKNVSKKQIMLFLQIVIISLLNFTGCIIYVYGLYISTNEFLIIVAQFCWFLIHGFPPVIYLTLNKTIRDDSTYLINICLSKNTVTKKLKFLFKVSNNRGRHQISSLT